MSTSASLNDSFISPTHSPTVSPTDQLTSVMIASSCLVILVVIVLLGSVIYRKGSFCFKSRAYQDSHADLDPSSQQYSSRQTLVSSPCTDSPQNLESFENINLQSGQLFYVGVPSAYCLPPMDPSMPHLPSYESVRKKDRQRQIHMMIADRFGLNGSITAENPPTYEESVRQSLQSLQVREAPSDTIPSPVMPQVDLSQPVNALPQYEEITPSTTSPDSTNDSHPEDSDEGELSCPQLSSDIDGQ